MTLLPHDLERAGKHYETQLRILKLEQAGERLARAATQVHDGASSEVWAELDDALAAWGEATR